MAAKVGIQTSAVAVFCANWLLGKNPQHGWQAAADHFGVSRQAITYHVRRMGILGLPSLLPKYFGDVFDFEALKTPIG